MKILFLTLVDFKSFNDRNIYCDLLREMIRDGHEVYCISPSEKRCNVQTHLEEHGKLLKLRIGNTQKTNLIEKGISTLMIEPQFKQAIRKYFPKVKFDMILYSTPPITLLSAITYVKKRDQAKTYLMLKDIFPQNAVDLGMMQKSGLKGLLYQFFRSKEKALYAASDRIGCMSQANVDYVLQHNPEIAPEILEICPNAIEPHALNLTDEERIEMRKKYGIPTEKTVFVYGGNLGKPQGIPFIIECLRREKDNEKAFFLLVGDGTEYGRIDAFVREESPANVKLMRRLPKEDYDRMIAACDVGMLFLDHRFTIPNFPSRMLSYMQAGLPVLACTDPNTDVGNVAVSGGFGWWCESNSVESVHQLIYQAMQCDTRQMGAVGYEYLHHNYSAEIVHHTVVKNA